MKKKLSELSLVELYFLRKILNKGLIDNEPTSMIDIEAIGYQHGHEKWKEKSIIRTKYLDNIDKAIVKKANEIDYQS